MAFRPNKINSLFHVPVRPNFRPRPILFLYFFIKYKLTARVIFPSFQGILYLFILYCVIFNPVYDTTKWAFNDILEWVECV